MVKNLHAMEKTGFDPWVGKIPWTREWQPTPVFLPGEFHRQRRLAGYSPWGHKELDTSEWLTSSVIKNLPANVGDTGLIPVPETKTHMLQGTLPTQGSNPGFLVDFMSSGWRSAVFEKIWFAWYSRNLPSATAAWVFMGHHVGLLKSQKAYFSR